jgi:hypothetical protein
MARKTGVRSSACLQSGVPPGDNTWHLMQSTEQIAANKAEIARGERMDLDEDTRKLQKAFSKHLHKMKRGTRALEPGTLMLVWVRGCADVKTGRGESGRPRPMQGAAGD